MKLASWMEHEVTLSEIQDLLQRASCHEEASAIRNYMLERSSFIDRLEAIEIFGHDAGSPIEFD